MLHLMEAIYFVLLFSTINTNAQGHRLNIIHIRCYRFVCHNWSPTLHQWNHNFFPLLSFLFSFFCLTFFLSSLWSVLRLFSQPLAAGNSILHSAADSVTSAVQKASQALNERGERLGRAEERTADMMNSAEQFAVTAHKVRQYESTKH